MNEGRRPLLTGILAVDKAQGWSSHDVVARVRRIVGQREVGHAGTLDPLATGVLLLVLGGATRVSSYLMEGEKVYRAEVVLGATTVTDDAEGALLQPVEVPAISIGELTHCVAAFVGEISQVPPSYAAVRHNGERLYKLARKGVDVQPVPRRVTVHEITVENYTSRRLRLHVRCGPGTYIRSLARDIGASLGVGGYLHALRRVASSGFSASRALSVESLTRESIEGALEPIDRAVLHWPAVVLDEDDAGRVRQGQPVQLGATAAGTVRLYGPTGELAGFGNCTGATVKPFRVFMGVEHGAHGH